jgi:hypothetical protein
VFGIVGDEAMPEMVIYPTAARKENRKLDAKRFPSFPQVTGKYGYQEPRCFDVELATSPNGSMTAELFEEWMCEKVLPLWPDLCDQPGKRVMMKADGGPGWQVISFLARAKVEGCYHLPGGPNTTKETQEMDQLFSALKGRVYANRDKLYEARFKIDGYNAHLTLNDVGFLIHGGDIRLSNGQTIHLVDAFSEYLSPQHIRRAREKCGYCPATRNALNGNRVRHEVVEGEEDEEDDESSDPLGFFWKRSSGRTMNL